jgi:hypothetical protein
MAAIAARVAIAEIITHYFDSWDAYSILRYLVQHI